MEQEQKEKFLEKVQLSVMQRFTGLSDSCCEVEGFTLEEYEEFCADDLATKVNMFVYGQAEEMPPVRYPDGPWQWFKLRYMPKWFLGEFPVQWKEVKQNFWIIYPNFEPVDDDFIVRSDIKYIEAGKLGEANLDGERVDW